MSNVLSFVFHASLLCQKWSTRLFFIQDCENRIPSPSLRAKPSLILIRSDEGLDHFGMREVAVEGVQLVEPEVIAVEVRVGGVVGIAAQITEVLHQHEGAVELLLGQRPVFGYVSQRPRPRSQ